MFKTLGISLKGRPSDPSSWSNLYPRSIDFIHEVDQWVETRPGWSGRVFSFGQAPSVFMAQVHPGVDPVQLHTTATGATFLRARTAPVGPGYHRHLVNFIDELTQKFGIEWEETEKADSTGFFDHRSQIQLEIAFTKWLGQFAEHLLKLPAKGCISMDLPHGLRVDCESGVATTLGPRDRDWLESVAQDPEKYLHDFYPWWDLPMDADYYRGVALTLGWNLVAWRKPATDRERQVMQAFVAACEAVVAMRKEVPLPRDAWWRCYQWLRSEGETDTEDSGEFHDEDFGYRQGSMHFPVGLGWSLKLPGIYIQDQPEGMGTWVAWYQNRRVEVRVLPVSTKQTPDEILKRKNSQSPGERLIARQNKIGFQGVGDCGMTEDGRFVLQAEYLQGDSVLVLQAISEQEDRDWAVEIWESVRRS